MAVQPNRNCNDSETQYSSGTKLVAIYNLPVMTVTIVEVISKC